VSSSNRPCEFNKRSLFIGAHASARPLRDQTHRELVYRPLQFHKWGQLFIGAHYEALSRAAHAVIRVYDRAGNMIETHQHAGQFRLIFI